MLDCISLNPPIQIGCHLTHNTRCLVHFAMTVQCRLPLSKHHFQQKTITWWNSLPQLIFSNLLFFVIIFISIQSVCYSCMVVIVHCKYLYCMLYVLYCKLYLYCMLHVLALLYVLVLYVVTLCTVAWKNSFAECCSLNK